MIIALAGRRIDAVGAEQPRFPLKNIKVVGQRVRAMLQHERATTVVCAAACGADLITLSEAGFLQLRRRVVLSSSRDRFRETSVVDRPGDWGSLYDQILDEVEASKDLVILRDLPNKEAYSLANLAILDEAAAIGQQLKEPVRAVLIWDGKFNRENDITGKFGEEAGTRGWTVLEVSTLAD